MKKPSTFLVWIGVRKVEIRFIEIFNFQGAQTDKITRSKEKINICMNNSGELATKVSTDKTIATSQKNLQYTKLISVCHCESEYHRN